MGYKKWMVLLCLMLFMASLNVYADRDNRVIVLLYHNLSDDYDATTEGVNISPENFEQHMIAILDEGYTPITFEDYYDASMGEDVLPEKPIIITFDDGYLSNYTEAYPILKRHDIKATIFIVTDSVGNGGDWRHPHFSWEQALEMQQSGLVSIQSHSDTHVDFQRLSDAEIITELRRSRWLIEKNLGNECMVFAYPYGLNNPKTDYMVATSGYTMQCIVKDDGVNFPQNRTVGLSRFTIRGDMTSDNLKGTLRELSGQKP